jgi:multidrug transporter EmrE-like cation transporter
VHGAKARLKGSVLPSKRVGKDNLFANCKILALSILVILSNVVGNCFLNMGVKGEKLVSLASVLKLVVSPTLVAGVLLLIAWMLLRMALLSTSPMSVVLPLTGGIAYVLTGGIGQFWFAEKVPITYDCGLLFIIAGVLLVGTSGSAVDTRTRESDVDSRACESTTAEYH